MKKQEKTFPDMQESFMNRYEKFEQLIKEIRIINDEIRKNWTSEASGLLCSSFDDSLHYIEKITDSFRDTLENCQADNSESSLSDFSF